MVPAFGEPVMRGAALAVEAVIFAAAVVGCGHARSSPPEPPAAPTESAAVDSDRGNGAGLRTGGETGASAGRPSTAVASVADSARPEARVAQDAKEDAKAEAEAGTSTPAVETLAGTQPRIPWVNPARCLVSCASPPEGRLVRLNDRGDIDRRGKHRVVEVVAKPVGDLLAAARTAGHAIRINSAFRSYQEQARVFRNTKERGRAARPGHSEHQLGTAVDLRLPTSAAIAWLADNAAAHGFALSYPAGKQRLTGYRPEPWHVRFVGGDTAELLRHQGLTLEEHFRAQPALGASGNCADCPAAASRMACDDSVTTAGACAGTVLTWCYDGAVAAVDCVVSGQTCGRTPDDAHFDCLVP